MAASKGYPSRSTKGKHIIGDVDGFGPNLPGLLESTRCSQDGQFALVSASSGENNDNPDGDGLFGCRVCPLGR
jgi:hypothetical protein